MSRKAKHFGIVLGTRPEIIKLSSIIRSLSESKINWSVIHTNQHYSKELDSYLFQDLDLPPSDYNLNVGSGWPSWQTGNMMIGIEKILKEDHFDCMIVQGDTNSVLAGALSASKLGIPVAHVEAGLRSYDRTMPEEINRILTDHISDFLFPPTSVAAETLLNENLPESKIFEVGNTVVDAVFQNQKIAEKKSRILTKLKLLPEKYVLMTVHRSENTKEESHITNIFVAIELLMNKYEFPVVYPIHPRTKKFIKTKGIEVPENLKLIDPVGYLDFIKLMKHAVLVLTDSGGVQEESCILQVPCVTLRENTERPETLKVGSNILAGTNSDRIVKAADSMITKAKNWENPFGNGTTGKQIINILNERL